MFIDYRSPELISWMLYLVDRPRRFLNVVFCASKQTLVWSVHPILLNALEWSLYSMGVLCRHRHLLCMIRLLRCPKPPSPSRSHTRNSPAPSSFKPGSIPVSTLTAVHSPMLVDLPMQPSKLRRDRASIRLSNIQRMGIVYPQPHRIRSFVPQMNLWS